MMRPLMLALVGSLLGFFGGRLSRPVDGSHVAVAPARSRPSDETHGGSTAVVPAPCVACDAAEDSVSTQLKRVQDAIIRQRVAVVGSAPEAPNDIPTAYLPEHVYGAVQAILAKCDGVQAEMVDLDCSEFPCLLYQFRPIDSSDNVRSVRDCPGWNFQSNSGGVEMSRLGEFQWLSISPVGWYGEADAAAVKKRLRYRSEVGMEFLQDDVGLRQ